jgi:hypothetical protein
MSDLKLSDYLADPSDPTGDLDLGKVVGLPVVAVHGYPTAEFGELNFKVTSIFFSDGSWFSVEGEHDHPYVEMDTTPRVAHFETVARLHSPDLSIFEHDDEEDDEEDDEDEADPDSAA